METKADRRESKRFKRRFYKADSQARLLILANIAIKRAEAAKRKLEQARPKG